MAAARRRLGRTGLLVSPVGIGTCQLRLVPRRQALATLRRAFDLGVDLVHTAPDYAGAQELVAEAVRASGRRVVVCSQGWGDPAQVERQLDEATRLFGAHGRLDLFGIACVDDREALGEPLFSRGGLVDVLLRRKAEGRLGGIFCTTHGSPAYIARLLSRDVFDVVMTAYNPLGFHLLSYRPPSPERVESLEGNLRILALCAERDVGVLVMKPLAGGLLVPAKAFPPAAEIRPDPSGLTASDVLRALLELPGVSCVVPGTASVAEAEENARAAGEGPLPPDRRALLDRRVAELRGALCSRCGLCDAQCSRRLPVSFLFRAAYLRLFPSATFETPPGQDYFTLQEGPDLACETCTDVACRCPAGLDVPARLREVHALMRQAEGRSEATRSRLGSLGSLLSRLTGRPP